MSNPKHTAYERLKELHEEAESATYAWIDTGKSTEWRQKVQSAFRRLFGDDCEQLKAFNRVNYSPIMFSMGTPDSVFHDSFMGGMKTSMGIIRSAIQEYEDYELDSAGAATLSTTAESLTETRKVFVVHGHDNEMKETVARFLERIAFEPIILHEQASAGDTIIEKFERNADVGYAVVLLSPDDVGAVKTKRDTLQPRARQNVVLELGYFVGRLGRSHVCPLVRGPLEVPSDFHGVVYVPFQGEDWKIYLVKELKHLGFDIDANKAF
ncbi:MAG: TIR domain-containing protein [Leptolyngbyaceae cyanobacterium]